MATSIPQAARQHGGNMVCSFGLAAGHAAPFLHLLVIFKPLFLPLVFVLTFFHSSSLLLYFRLPFLFFFPFSLFYPLLLFAPWPSHSPPLSSRLATPSLLLSPSLSPSSLSRSSSTASYLHIILLLLYLHIVFSTILMIFYSSSFS